MERAELIYRTAKPGTPEWQQAAEDHMNALVAREQATPEYQARLAKTGQPRRPVPLSDPFADVDAAGYVPKPHEPGTCPGCGQPAEDDSRDCPACLWAEYWAQLALEDGTPD